MTIVRVRNRISAKRKRNKWRGCAWGLCLCRSLLAVSEAGEAWPCGGGPAGLRTRTLVLFMIRGIVLPSFDTRQNNSKGGLREKPAKLRPCAWWSGFLSGPEIQGKNSRAHKKPRLRAAANYRRFRCFLSPVFLSLFNSWEVISGKGFIKKSNCTRCRIANCPSACFLNPISKQK